MAIIYLLNSVGKGMEKQQRILFTRKPPKDWLDRSTPKTSVTRKDLHRVEDAFRAEGRSNIVLRNLYTDQGRT